MSTKKRCLALSISALSFILINDYKPYLYAFQGNSKKTPILEAEHFSSKQWAQSKFFWSDTYVGLKPFPEKAHVTRTEKRVSDIAHGMYITRLAQLKDREVINIQEVTNRIDFILLAGAGLVIFWFLKFIVSELEPVLSEEDIKTLRKSESKLSADDVKNLKELSRTPGTGKLLTIRLAQIGLVCGGFAVWVLLGVYIYSRNDAKHVPSRKLVEHGEFLYIDNGLLDRCKVSFGWCGSDGEAEQRITEIPPLSLVQFVVPIGRLTVRAAAKSACQTTHLEIEEKQEFGFYVYDVFEKNEFRIESVKYR